MLAPQGCYANLLKGEGMKRKIKSSIHIKKANVYFILHSVRANASYSVVFTDEKNEYLYDKETALKLFRDGLKKRKLKYTERTGKKLPKNTATLLSAIVNLYPTHTLEDVKKIAQHLEKTLDTKVVSVAIHRDEGKLIKKDTGEEFYSGVDFILNTEDNKLYWVDENKKLKEEVNLEEFEIVKNYHAHLEFLGLDSNGVAIKRNKLNKYYLSKLQTFVAETLGMERGYNYYLNNKKAPKRLDVKEFKVSGVLKREGAKLARVKDLKELNKQIREFYKENKAERADYAELEEFVKKLKERIKNKELTIAELVKLFDMQLKKFIKKINEQEEMLINLYEREEDARKEAEELLKEKAKLKELVYSKKYTYKDTKKPVPNAEVVEFLEKELNKKDKQIKELKNKLLQSENRVQELKEENERLKEQLELLQKAIKEQKEQIAKETAELSSKNKIATNIENYFIYALSNARHKFNCKVKLQTKDGEIHNYATFEPSYEAVKQIKRVLIEKENKYTLIDDLEEDNIYVTNLSDNEEDVKKMILNGINLMLKKGYKLEDINYHTKSERNLKIFQEIKEYLLNKSTFEEEKEIKSKSVSNNFSFKFKR